MIFIDLNTQNILVPWIYFFFNNDFTPHLLPPNPKPVMNTKPQSLMKKPPSQ
jgi:hypothetical protein